MFLNEVAASLYNLGDLFSNRIEAHFPFGSQKSLANWKGNPGKLQGLKQQGPILQFRQAIHRYCTLWRNLPEDCITLITADILFVASKVLLSNQFRSPPHPSEDTDLYCSDPQPRIPQEGPLPEPWWV